MAVLITGGAGYIGSHTCVELPNANYEVVVLDNFNNSKPEAIKRIREITGRSFTFYTFDLLDEDSLDNVFKENDIEAVIHFAGLKAVGESVNFPLTFNSTNIISTLTLCRTMQRHHVKKIVFSSSATVYGTPVTFPISEESPLGALNPYGRTKLIIEEMLKDLYQSGNDWSISILRYFNPVGAHYSGLIGEDPNGIPNNLMPYITQVAIGKLKELNVFGDQYPTPDGTGIRDYIHVVDLALGHLRALERATFSSGVEVYNLGTGKGYSVLEMIKAFEKASGMKIPYKIVSPRPGDVAICYADPYKEKVDLGWIAKKQIDEMCEDAWRWQNKNPNGYSHNPNIDSPYPTGEGFFVKNK